MVDDEGKPNRERPYGTMNSKILAGRVEKGEEANREQAQARAQLSAQKV